MPESVAPPGHPVEPAATEQHGATDAPPKVKYYMPMWIRVLLLIIGLLLLAAANGLIK